MQPPPLVVRHDEADAEAAIAAVLVPVVVDDDVVVDAVGGGLQTVHGLQSYGVRARRARPHQVGAVEVVVMATREAGAGEGARRAGHGDLQVVPTGCRAGTQG